MHRIASCDGCFPSPGRVYSGRLHNLRFVRIPDGISRRNTSQLHATRSLTSSPKQSPHCATTAPVANGVLFTKRTAQYANNIIVVMFRRTTVCTASIRTYVNGNAFLVNMRNVNYPHRDMQRGSRTVCRGNNTESSRRF